MIFHENCLLADNSHEISFLICYYEKAAKFEIVVCCKIIGGALRVKICAILHVFHIYFVVHIFYDHISKIELSNALQLKG